ncbi:hypothetical protein, partial [Spongiactinospora gelatinilytica]|uniref:hypothetical protein n=1 Tax=Spongiactinospora gelatinilytica TaxID=2666298 RepID=UPI003F660D11
MGSGSPLTWPFPATGPPCPPDDGAAGLGGAKGGADGGPPYAAGPADRSPSALGTNDGVSCAGAPEGGVPYAGGANDGAPYAGWD